MNRDSNINQFIPLHFYEVGEKLPADDENKIVIYEVPGGFSAAIGYYNNHYNYWFDSDGTIEDVIAWASFSPEWVTGTYPGEWGKQ